MAQLSHLSGTALDDRKFTREKSEPGKGKTKAHKSVSPYINVRDVVYELESALEEEET